MKIAIIALLVVVGLLNAELGYGLKIASVESLRKYTESFSPFVEKIATFRRKYNNETSSYKILMLKDSRTVIKDPYNLKLTSGYWDCDALNKPFSNRPLILQSYVSTDNLYMSPINVYQDILFYKLNTEKEYFDFVNKTDTQNGCKFQIKYYADNDKITNNNIIKYININNDGYLSISDIGLEFMFDGESFYVPSLNKYINIVDDGEKKVFTLGDTINGALKLKMDYMEITYSEYPPYAAFSKSNDKIRYEFISLNNVVSSFRDNSDKYQLKIYKYILGISGSNPISLAASNGSLNMIHWVIIGVGLIVLLI